MSNFNELTDDELRWEVAERLGWTKLEWVDSPNGGSTLVGNDPYNSQHCETPNWPNDCNEALTVFQKTGGEELVINLMNMELIADWHTFKDDERFKTTILDESYHEEPIARAICVTFCQWMELK